MSEQAYAKCSCRHCDGHIEFPVEAAGASIACPHCSQSTVLTLPEPQLSLSTSQIAQPEPATAAPAPAPESAPSAFAPTAVELVQAFSGPVPPTPVSPLYTVGLLLVTGMMVVLPAIYLAMIAAAAWGEYFWATHFYGIVAPTRGGARAYLLKLMIYGGPLFIGAVLIFFMVKPLFARRAPHAQPLALNPGAEPVLFAFIAKICETVGAPFPKRIDLDCQLNAAASFRRGLWSLFSNDLVLTIGLPLVAGLSLRQFAGVLAHEFGHFTQGFGMRLTYVIRSVSAWFARVVYERDAWDVALAEWGQSDDWRVAIIVGCARLAVGLSRQLLKLLMLLGHGISCFMLRQMEYDADSYEVKLAGSEAFEAGTLRIHVLSEALEQCYKDMRTTWNLNRRLPDNFPGYLLSHEAQMSPQHRAQLEDTLGLGETGLFDTHPSNGDRIRRARQANQPGVFQFDGPASALFSNFEVPARQVTLLHYADDLDIPVELATLHSVVEPAPPVEETPRADAAPSAQQAEGAGPRLKLQRPG